MLQFPLSPSRRQWRHSPPYYKRGRARYGVHFNKRRKQEVRTVNPYFTLNKKEKVRWIVHAEPFT